MARSGLPLTPRFGTDELARNVTEALDGRSAALMANHGAITTGPTVDKALSLLPYLEYICEVHLRAMSTGHPIKVLDDKQTVDATRGIAGYKPKVVDEA